MTPDWRAILVKYLAIVGRAEGVDFLYKHEWSPEDWQALESITAEEVQAVEL